MPVRTASFFYRPVTLLIMLGLVASLVVVTLGLQKRARQNVAVPTPVDVLTLTDYVVGVVRTLDAGQGEVRLTPGQAKRLLYAQDDIRSDLNCQTEVSRSSTTALFAATLNAEQVRAILTSDWRRGPRVFQAADAMASLVQVLQRRSGES